MHIIRGGLIMKYLPTGRGIILYVILSIITFGIYPLYIIHAFAKETNISCRKDGKHTSGLFVYIVLSILTFGIYSFIWHCLIVVRRGTFLESNKQRNNLSLVFYLIGIFFGVFTLGILTLIAFGKYINQQNLVNRFYNQESSQTTTSNTSLENKLKQLSDLYNRGVLTENEYKLKRRQAIEAIN